MESSKRQLFSLRVFDIYILNKLSGGFSIKEICKDLNLMERTVNYYIKQLLCHYCVEDISELVGVFNQQAIETNFWEYFHHHPDNSFH